MVVQSPKSDFYGKKMQKIDTIERLSRAEDGPDDPMALFAAWMNEAEGSEINDPNAMSLATIDPDGRPSLRIVLLKQFDARGFAFFTNQQSRKGLALAAHPQAALCLHWKSLRRQVRIEGTVTKLPDRESDDYYQSRPHGSRIGAWASDQSRPLPGRAALVEKVAALMKTYPEGGAIPRPPHWGGYRLAADYIEFWHDGADRLHTRLVYKRAGSCGWERLMLYP